jgi:hypothetical protein
MSLLAIAIIVLFVTAGLGVVLVGWHAAGRRGPPWVAGAIHGLIGMAGFGLLLPALRGPLRGVQEGGQAFGLIAAVLLGAALVAAIGPAAARLRRRRIPAVVMGLHATLAVMGVVLAAVYLSLPP